MVKYTFILAIILGTAKASCPLLDAEAFRETLNNNSREMIINGMGYQITDRKKPEFSLKSPYKPQIEIRETTKKSRNICKYTRRIGKQKFGSFTLKEKHKKPVIRVFDEPERYTTWGEDRNRRVIRPYIYR